MNDWTIGLLIGGAFMVAFEFALYKILKKIFD